jgi:hypothetical protein
LVWALLTTVLVELVDHILNRVRHRRLRQARRRNPGEESPRPSHESASFGPAGSD